MIYESAARTRALKQLGSIDPVGYASSRNHLDGAVTRLSPFLRHGVLSLAEVRDVALAKADQPSRGSKLIQELAWRDYFQRVWQILGDHIWSDIEPYKTGFAAADYADELPADLLCAQTGIDYIDHFAAELVTTGYLHNHARLWLAAYIVHGRRVKWQAGARWFLSHLLDGDEASNNLSWQWCASTFSHKPYIFNRENVLKYSGNRFAQHQPNDPFDTDYQTLARKLFPQQLDLTENLPQPPRQFDLRVQVDAETPIVATDPTRTLVWIHDGMMSPAHPAICLGQTHLFLWDDQHIAAHNHSQHRLWFQRSALFCPDVHSQHRPLANVLIDAARARGLDSIITGQTSDPRLLRTIDQLKASIHVQVIPDRPFVELTGRLDLTRFSRYWAKAQTALA
jgi:deoxyribodipyrimidine photo-lyase